MTPSQVSLHPSVVQRQPTPTCMIQAVAEGMRADNTSEDKSVAATVRTPPCGFHLMLEVALHQRDIRLKDRCSPLPGATNGSTSPSDLTSARRPT